MLPLKIPLAVVVSLVGVAMAAPQPVLGDPTTPGVYYNWEERPFQPSETCQGLHVNDVKTYKSQNYVTIPWECVDPGMKPLCGANVSFYKEAAPHDEIRGRVYDVCRKGCKIGMSGDIADFASHTAGKNGRFSCQMGYH